MKFKKASGDSFLKRAAQEARALVQEHDHNAGKKIQKKMPLQMLVGIRKKQKEIHRKEQEFNSQAQITYNSFRQGKSGQAFVQKEKTKSKRKDKKPHFFKPGAGSGVNFKNGVMTVKKGRF